MPARRPSLSPIDTQVSVTTQSAPFDRRVRDRGRSRCRRPTPGPVEQPFLAARAPAASRPAARSRSCCAACIHEASTLLASPVQATLRPRIGPRCSSKVMTSAMTWQGCERRVRPLITGTVAWRASSSSIVVLEGADHDGVDVAREHARRIGDGLAAAELHLLAGQHDGLAAELAHGDVERDARARRRLVEDHRQRLAGERPVWRTRRRRAPSWRGSPR